MQSTASSTASELEIAAAREVLKAFQRAGFEAMLAGGCVRDRLLGLVAKDFDIASNATPEETTRVAEINGWKAVPTGLDHGTVSVIVGGSTYEVTTLRRDVETDGRRAVVDFRGASFADDAARRDFTINALYEDEAGIIHDFVGGQADLAAKRLVFVGSAEQRIKEDYLRILRFYRFWSRFGFAPDLEAVAAIQKLKTGLGQISRERISLELWGILSGPHAAEALASLCSDGVLPFVLSTPTLPDTAAIKQVAHQSGDRNPDVQAWALFCLLLGVPTFATSIPAAQSAARGLRWSAKQEAQLVRLIRGWNGLESIGSRTWQAMEFIDEATDQGKPDDFLQLTAPIWRRLLTVNPDRRRLTDLERLQAVESTQQALRLASLPVTGHDVQSVRPDFLGARIGQALTQLKRDFRDSLWSSRDEGLARLSALN